MTRFLVLGALLALPAFSSPLLAQEGASPPAEDQAAEDQGPDAPAAFSLSGSVTALTDYRFRGISLSGQDPAAQASVTIDHASGFYAGLFASTLGGRAREGDAELDLYAGFGREVAPGTDLDLGIIYYFFPGSRAGAAPIRHYVEPYASLSHTIGPVTAKAGVAYAPEQDSIGGDNLYLFGELSGSVPGTPFTLTGRVGRSDGGLAPGGAYWDWRIGAEAALGGGLTAGLAYVDTDLAREGAGGTALATLRFSF